ncbi:MAG: PilZ domain-containing protein [Anaerohalosphaeraceae bacterium]|nr:PilZ domain-containing protein [Anaerohalosphaeraceae bacterium]
MAQLELMQKQSETAVIEHRQSDRTDMQWPVSCWIPEANRFFNGKTVNVSKGGVKVSLPMTAPVRDGSVIEINFPRTINLAKKKGQFARIKMGKIIRVDRNTITSNAAIGIAVEFS